MTRIAVITGGGGDMGLACARRLAPGHGLLLADIDDERLRAARERLAESNISAETLRTDISDADAIEELAKRAAELGPLGALVHTAGLSPTMATGERIWDVNLVGSQRLMDAFRPLPTEGSAAVLIASQAGHFSRDGATPELEAFLDEPLADDLIERVRALAPELLESSAAYAASKYGVIRLAAREALEWGARGARVISLSPGIIDTGMGRQEYAAQPFMETMVERTPLGRMGQDDDIAKAVEFLCSDGAAFITATDLLVDGGSTEALRRLIPPTLTGGNA